MQVRVDDVVVTLFLGARVQDAIRMFSRAALRDVRRGLARVIDDQGREVGLDGALFEGGVLHLVALNEDLRCD